ncbi:MAG: hypothetical protein HRF49_01065 [bacterium]
MIRIFFAASLFVVFLAGGALAQGFSVALGGQEFTASPGETVSGRISVSNGSEKPTGVKVYAGDLVRDAEKTQSYQFKDEGGYESRSLIPWLTFTPDQITLDPGGSAEVLYQIEIPADESLSGSYWGVIYVSSIPSEEPLFKEDEPAEEKKPKIGIRMVFRYAVKIYVTIKGTETRGGTFKALNVAPAKGGFDATALFENTGNVWMRPKCWLELRDATGAAVFTQEHSEQTVLPESALDFKFEVRGAPVPPGEYLLMVIADYGGEKLVAAQARVNISEPPPESESAAESSAETEAGSSAEAEVEN